MRIIITIVSYVSFTESDNYIHTEQQTFTNRLLAQDYYEEQCKQAHDECKWGSQWDEPEDKRDENCAYDVDEERSGSYQESKAEYKVSSHAYDGYHVKVSYVTVFIDLPFVTDRTKYGMTLKEIRDEIAAFTGDKKGEAMRKAKIFAHNISISHVSRIRLSFGQYSKTENGKTVYYGENRDTLHFRWTDLEGDSDTFSIIE